MTFYEFVKPKLKKILGVSIASALLATVLMPVLNTAADGPRFNFKDGDYELFRGLNKTANETVWKDPMTGTAGDEFTGLIYYHNGVLETSATNTKIRVDIPTGTTNGQAVLSATISADNAETVTDTVINGQIIGRSGLTIVLPEDAALEFVPGSVLWYPDSYGVDDPQSQILPNGQTGNEITGAGINLGEIQGCWQYAGFVKFTFKTKKIVTPKLLVTKEVRNITRGENTFSKSTVAYNANQVEFKIDIQNTGTDPLQTIVSKDTMPVELSFISGTFKKVIGLGTYQDLPDADFAEFIGTGLNLGNALSAGGSEGYIFRARAEDNIASEKTVTNLITVTADSVTASDTATVLEKVTVANIEKHKSAVNITTGAAVLVSVSDDIATTSLTASAGDEISYKLFTSSKENPTSNYVIEDGIADILEYAEVTSISNGGSVVTGTSGNDSMLVKWPAVNIAKDQTVERTFSIKIKNPLPLMRQNGYSFDDKLYNEYGDIVIVTILRPTPPVKEVKLSIEKTVRNFTASESVYTKSNEAYAGDILEYNISFRNAGNAPADQVKFYDLLPANVNHISGTTVISFNGRAERTVIDGLVGNGIIIDSIPTGDSGYIRFRVLISATIAAGENLVNTVYLEHGTTKLNDSAATKIKQPAPGPVTPTPTLPKTGAAASASFMITFTAGIAGSIRRYKKEISGKLEVMKITNGIRNL
ncbi:MAG: hypothetical protein AAB881_00015 [Patescibacteria group bacterium]